MGSSRPPPHSPWNLDDEKVLRAVAESPYEWQEFYRPGGYHPIVIGDTLCKGRYKIIRKLGFGRYSTVWLALDEECDWLAYRAIKVLMAKHSSRAKILELEMSSLLNQEDDRPGVSGHLLKLLDSFEEMGPNGVHTCMVYEPMGSTVADGIKMLPEYRGQSDLHEVWRYPKQMAKQILKQTLLGLDRLHRLGIVHGDLHTGNLLFTAQGLNHIAPTDLTQDPETTEALKPLDGWMAKWAPAYRALPQPLYDHTDFSDDLKIYISDLGGAFFRGQPPDKLVTQAAFRAPEIVLNQQVDEKIDIWSFGCLMYELVTGCQLFFVWPDEDDKMCDAQMMEFNNVLGDLPDKFKELWPRSSDWFGPDGERRCPGWEEMTEEQRKVFSKHPTSRLGLRAAFEAYAPRDIKRSEAEVIMGIIRWSLRYEPSHRPTAADLLKNGWFNSE